MPTLSSNLCSVIGATCVLLLASCSSVRAPNDNDVLTQKPSEEALTPVVEKKPASIVDKTEKKPAATVKPTRKSVPAKVPALVKKPVPIKKVAPVKQVVEPIKKTRPIKTAPAVVAQPKNTLPPSLPAGSVKGRVLILGRGNKSYSPADVIVSLAPINTGKSAKLKNAHHNIVTRNKTYNPAVMTILKGDTLNFQNRDQIKHNVFSSSKDNIFDLGTYAKGRDRAIKMNTPGVVKVYCNIHAEMATFVMVAENEWNNITDKKGLFEIKNVPPGEYKLSLWHIRGSLERTIVVSSDDLDSLTLTLNTATYKPAEHKNKFGKNYKKKPALFEDEFY